MKKLWILMILTLVLTAGAVAQAGPPPPGDAGVYAPAPGLRLYYWGVAGTDGTLYRETLVSASLADDELVTQAETEVQYYLPNRQMALTVPAGPVRQGNIWRYAYDGEQLCRVALTGKRPPTETIWLPRMVAEGVTWKAPWGSRREIVSTDATVDTAAGRFEHCLVVEYDVYAGSTAVERYYYAPGLGVVKVVALRKADDDKGAIWRELQRVEPVDRQEAASMISQMLSR